jgi:ribosomal protein S18 acetylase RimI-like enzyme
MQFQSTVSIQAVKPSQLKAFSCGIHALDEYLGRYAKNHEKINLSRTFVLCGSEETPEKILGYYTVCNAQIAIEDLPESHRQKLPRFPIPASRLCRLAVDQSFQQQGIGQHLLMDAMNRILHANKSIASHCMVVDAKNPQARKFYLKYGFIPLMENGLSLFLPLETLKKARIESLSLVGSLSP